MYSIRGLFAAGMLACAGTALAKLDFNTDATLHDYPSLADGSGANNPPWCEMGYDSLDLNSITAYCAIDKSQCGTCIEVCGSKGCKVLLVVDQCARGPDGLLDISTGAGMEIGGAITGHLQVKATQVDASKCEHIWNGKMFFDYQAPYGELATLASMADGSVVAATAPAPVTYPAKAEPTSIAAEPSSAEKKSSTTETKSSSAETEATSVYSVALPSSSAKVSPTYSAPVEYETAVGVESDGGPITTGNGSQSSASPTEEFTTITSTLPGSTVYYTVTLSHGSTAGVLAETAVANDSTTRVTTTIRSTSTVWSTQTSTITGIQSTGTTTLTSAVQTTSVTSAYAARASGHQNSTETDHLIETIKIFNDAESAGAYAAEVKERHPIAAHIPHAKRSAAFASARSQGWDAVMALSGLTALAIMAI